MINSRGLFALLLFLASSAHAGDEHSQKAERVPHDKTSQDATLRSLRRTLAQGLAAGTPIVEGRVWRLEDIRWAEGDSSHLGWNTEFRPLLNLARETNGFVVFEPSGGQLTAQLEIILERESATVSAGRDKPVEILFLVDTTPSMQQAIAEVSLALKSFAERAALRAGGRPRLGLATFDDGKRPLHRMQNLSDDREQFLRNVSFLRVAKGDRMVPEKSYDAVLHALSLAKWSSDEETHRVIVLLTDAPPRPKLQDDTDGYTASVNGAQAKRVAIYPVVLTKPETGAGSRSE